MSAPAVPSTPLQRRITALSVLKRQHSVQMPRNIRQTELPSPLTGKGIARAKAPAVAASDIPLCSVLEGATPGTMWYVGEARTGRGDFLLAKSWKLFSFEHVSDPSMTVPGLEALAWLLVEKAREKRNDPEHVRATWLTPEEDRRALFRFLEDNLGELPSVTRDREKHSRIRARRKAEGRRVDGRRRRHQQEAGGGAVDNSATRLATPTNGVIKSAAVAKDRSATLSKQLSSALSRKVSSALSRKVSAASRGLSSALSRKVSAHSRGLSAAARCFSAAASGGSSAAVSAGGSTVRASTARRSDAIAETELDALIADGAANGEGRCGAYYPDLYGRHTLFAANGDEPAAAECSSTSAEYSSSSAECSSFDLANCSIAKGSMAECSIAAQKQPQHPAYPAHESEPSSPSCGSTTAGPIHSSAPTSAYATPDPTATASDEVYYSLQDMLTHGVSLEDLQTAGYVNVRSTPCGGVIVS